MTDLTAFILAGGKSTRMGEDKAFLKLDGRMLIDIAMRRLKGFDCDIFLVGPREKFNSFGRVLEDRFADSGPLAGIHRALDRSDTEWSLITAVDIPLVPFAFLEAIVDRARKSEAQVVLPRTASGYQPLCAVYRKSFFEAAERALQAKSLKIDRVILEHPHQIFDVEKEGFSAEIFLNVNTPEDLAAAERYVAKSQLKAAKP